MYTYLFRGDQISLPCSGRHTGQQVPAPLSAAIISGRSKTFSALPALARAQGETASGHSRDATAFALRRRWLWPSRCMASRWKIRQLELANPQGRRRRRLPLLRYNPRQTPGDREQKSAPASLLRPTRRSRANPIIWVVLVPRSVQGETGDPRSTDRRLQPPETETKVGYRQPPPPFSLEK